MEPAEGVDRGRLPGSVGTDQPDDLARLDVEAHVVHRDHAAVADRQVPHLEQRTAVRLPVCRRLGVAVGPDAGAAPDQLAGLG